MTLTRIEPAQLPPLLVFLETVCPGTPFLDQNIHFSLPDNFKQEKLKDIDELAWPLTDAAKPGASVCAVIDKTYLNVARPPFEHDVRRNIESTTYVSLPFHILDVFSQVCANTDTLKHLGGLHMGASVNPLMQDPFKLVHLNPGCFSSMIALSNLSRQHSPLAPEIRTPFTKMTTSINKLLRMGGIELLGAHELFFLSLIDAVPDSMLTLHISHPLSGKEMRKLSRPHLLFYKLLDYDEKTYFQQVKLPHTAKLLVAANVNILNVFALDENYAYANTESGVSTKLIFPLAEPLADQTQTSHPVTTVCKPYTKVTEKPLLRLQFRNHVIVTSMLTLSAEPLVVLGLNTGEIVYINLVDLTFRHFDDLGLGYATGQNSYLASVNAVTSLSAIWHANCSLLLVAGFANGEVAILDPSGAPSCKLGNYVKSVAGRDAFVTYFKKFDLSPLHSKDIQKENDESPEYLVGHFKLSHKAITSIASTMNYDSPSHSVHNPQILAIASEDGLVRFVDLISTHGKNYGDPLNFYNQLIVSDIVSNYFQDGIRSIEFSPDFRFFCVAGKGDLIEIFKLTYYNINGLLQKNESGHRAGRSRSGTVNSATLGNYNTPLIFLLPANTTPTTSLDILREDHHDTQYPLAVKDISIVSRLKGHTNTVERVSFLRNDDAVSFSIENSSSRAYKLVSCGEDGKVIFWDFDSKALPRVKKSHITTKKKKIVPEPSQVPLPAPHRGKPGLVPTITKSHHRTRSTSYQNEEMALTPSFSTLGINKLLSQSPQPLQHLENAEEHLKIVFSLYRSLYEVRLKKHYTQMKDMKKKPSCIIHAVVNDKTLPLIEIPLLSVDFSCLVKDGKLQGFHVNPRNFWVFGKNGDIFRYSLVR